MFCATLLFLQEGFVISFLNNIGAKAARKMLVKMTTERPQTRRWGGDQTGQQAFCSPGFEPSSK